MLWCNFLWGLRNWLHKCLKLDKMSGGGGGGGGGGDLPIVSDSVQITLLQGNSYLLCTVMVIANLVYGAIISY